MQRSHLGYFLIGSLIGFFGVLSWFNYEPSTFMNYLGVIGTYCASVVALYIGIVAPQRDRKRNQPAIILTFTSKPRDVYDIPYEKTHHLILSNSGLETAKNINIRLIKPAKTQYSMYPVRNLVISRIESIQNGQQYEVKFFEIDLHRKELSFPKHLEEYEIDIWSHSVPIDHSERIIINITGDNFPMISHTFVYNSENHQLSAS